MVGSADQTLRSLAQTPFGRWASSTSLTRSLVYYIFLCFFFLHTQTTDVRLLGTRTSPGAPFPVARYFLSSFCVPAAILTSLVSSCEMAGRGGIQALPTLQRLVAELLLKIHGDAAAAAHACMTHDRLKGNSASWALFFHAVHGGRDGTRTASSVSLSRVVSTRDVSDKVFKKIRKKKGTVECFYFPATRKAEIIRHRLVFPVCGRKYHRHTLVYPNPSPPPLIFTAPPAPFIAFKQVIRPQKSRSKAQTLPNYMSYHEFPPRLKSPGYLSKE